MPKEKETSIKDKEALAKFAEIDAAKLSQANHVLEMADVKKLTEKYNKLKPHSSGFPFNIFRRKQSTAEPPNHSLAEISKDLSMINTYKPMNLLNRNTVNEELLASRIRGCLLQHIAQTHDKTLKKTLASLLNEPGIKGTGKRAESQKDIEAFEAFQKTLFPQDKTKLKQGAKARILRL